MSSSTSKKQARTERARIVAEMQAAEARKEQRRRLALAGVAVVAVLIVVAALVGIGLSNKGDSAKTSAASGAASAAVVKGVTGVPAATFNAIGAGATSIVAPTSISAPALTSGGKPKVLYVGAEYCPYCAAQRWPIVVALSRFGTWSGLQVTKSSSTDTAPNTPTLSFHGASYKSDYLSFTGVEQQDRAGKTLESLSSADAKIESTYNKPPYVSSEGSIPFVDLGGTYTSQGASYSPDLLKGKTQEQVAAALSDASSPIAKAVDATANAYTATLCKLTGNKPANVCTSSGVTAAASRVK